MRVSDNAVDAGGRAGGERSTEPRGYREPDWSAYLRTLYRRRLLAGAALLLTFSTALVYAFAATPIYRATARLLLDLRDPQVVTFQEVINEGTLARNNNTQRDLLRSRAFARATIDRLGLWDHPEFTGADDSRTLNPMRIASSAPSSIRQAGPAVASAPGGPETRPESRAISRLLANLEIVTGRATRIVEVRFSARDPELAADVANTFARVYIERDMEFRYTSARDASEWLRERMEEQRRHLEASELALQRYREEHGAAAIEDRQNMIVRELANLRSAVGAATMARIESEARYRDLEAARTDPVALERFPEVLANTFVQEQMLNVVNLQRERILLAEALGPLHPDLIRIETSIREAEQRLRNEVAALVDSVALEYQVAGSRERELLAELERQTAEALELDRIGIEYGVMQRETESNRQLYQSLLRRAAETSVTGELETTNIRVVDEAEVPLGPTRPQRQMVLLIGLLGGTLIALGLVFAVEYVDDTIRTPDDVAERLQLPCLGMLPYAAHRDGAAGRCRWSGASAGGLPLLSSHAPASFTESIRAVCTSLVLSRDGRDCRSVLVTSAAPGEGKSCVAVNLAIALAQMGRSTLLVDADLREPHLHDLFAHAREPGLSNLLDGDPADTADPAGKDVVGPTNVPGLSLVAAGTVSTNPIGLIGSVRFTDLLTSWRERFDWVVLDTPPVQPVADALVTAGAVGDVLFVAAADNTSRGLAADALARLAQSNANVLGCVLNGADVARHPHYYPRYHRRVYERYYRHGLGVSAR